MNLSIITAVRNGAGTLRGCIESVQKQTLPAEHIVIDGASTDGTFDIIAQYRSSIAKAISEPDKGIYDALNKGIRLAKRVHFLGARSDIPRLIQATDVVVQPSRIEAGPIVPLEAMSSGVPVVATDVGANPEEVADGVTGILVPLGNHIAMAEAVIVLLEDALRREQLGKAGRSWVMQNFNLDAQSAKLDSIYSALIGKA